ncbi:MAG: hypothetical protein KF861_04935 [Planctomycetaceae bacterium]|nr:hypothetical protein [Planctomycetaceae bacterium]
MSRASDTHRSVKTSGAKCQAVLVLSRIPGQSVPRLSEAYLLRIPQTGSLLLSPTELQGSLVLIKRLSPRFARSFSSYRLIRTVLPSESTATSQPPLCCYGVQRVARRRRFPLSRVLARDLLSRQTARMRSLSRMARPTSPRRESLMPLLSAIGLAVVYATNFQW